MTRCQRCGRKVARELMVYSVIDGRCICLMCAHEDERRLGHRLYGLH